MGFEPTTLCVLQQEGCWVGIPSGAQIFSVSSHLWLILYISLYFLYESEFMS